MNKKVLKVSSIVLAIVMLFSTFSVAIAADAPKAVATTAAETQEDKWMITLGGREFNLLSSTDFVESLFHIGSTQELKYVALQYVEILAVKILTALEGSVPDPSYFKNEADFKSENFYKGTDKFISEPAQDAKWSLGYANASLVPDDWQTKDYYLGGFIDPNNGFSNKVENVVDDMKIRVVALDDGSDRGVTIFATVDAIGVSNAHIRSIRASLAEKAAKKDIKIASINVASTHAHSCIDTQGLWTNLFPKLLGNLVKGWTGLGSMEKGVDEEYMSFVVKTSADAMDKALDDMKEGTLTYAKKDIGDGYFNNKNRDSATSMDTTITRLEFTPDDVDAKPTIIANFAAHPDVAGLPTSDGKGTGRELCGEYPYYIEKFLNEYTNDALKVNEGGKGYNAYFINGAILGIYMARGVTGDGVPTVHRYEESIRYGTEIGRILIALDKTEQEIIADGNLSGKAQIDAEMSAMTDEQKKNYTIWYEGWTAVEEKDVKPILNIRIKEVYVPVTNPVIKLAGKLNLVNYGIMKAKDGSYKVLTEVGYVEFGDIMKAVMVPGEFTSDMVYGGGAITAEGSFACQDFQYDALVNIFDDEELTAFGLCNDAIGYILPDNDYSLISYHELISLGRYAGSSIVGALEEIAIEVGRKK